MNKELYPCVFIKETNSGLANCDLCTWCIYDWYSRRDQRNHKAHEVGVWNDVLAINYKLLSRPEARDGTKYSLVHQSTYI